MGVRHFDTILAPCESETVCSSGGANQCEGILQQNTPGNRKRTKARIRREMVGGEEGGGDVITQHFPLADVVRLPAGR